MLEYLKLREQLDMRDDKPIKPLVYVYIWLYNMVYMA